MKLFLILVGMGTAGVLGYMSEPSLRFQFTGLKPQGGAPSLVLDDKPVAPAVPAIDPASVPQNQLPKFVLLTQEVKIADKNSGMTMTISAGSKVKLIRVSGSNAVVRPGETDYTISIPYADTDLLAQLAANPPAKEALVVEPDPIPAVEPVKPEPVPVPTGDSEEPKPAPEPVAQNTTPTPAPEPAPQPEPPPMPEPAPAPEPAPQPAPPAATAKTAVQVMQESLRSGQIKEFTFEQVLDWKAGTEELVDGENYATGLVSYKAETIFGVKTIQAKALIKEGKVAKWIWPKSGMEIK
jgi:hypothetical protein